MESILGLPLNDVTKKLQDEKKKKEGGGKANGKANGKGKRRGQVQFDSKDVNMTGITQIGLF